MECLTRKLEEKNLIELVYDEVTGLMDH